MCETVTQQTRVAPRRPFLGSTSLKPTEAPSCYVRFLGLGHHVLKPHDSPNITNGRVFHLLCG